MHSSKREVDSFLDAVRARSMLSTPRYPLRR
jgi:hypothetical protein